MPEPLVVAKVGGSLFDLPDLAVRLTRSLAAHPRVLLVPGGGPTADVVRRYDATHGLGEEASHWLALQALSLNAALLARLLPAALLADLPAPEGGWHVLDPNAFCRRDEAQPDHLPHRWTVTSDSLAVRIAAVAGAAELVLVKSIPCDTTRPWSEAAAAGVVDAYFPDAVRQVPRPTMIRVVNLRDERFSIRAH